MAAVQQHNPGAINELLAYIFTIIRVAQEFEDPAWRSYDEAFREKAAATGNHKWSEINSLIYNRVFHRPCQKNPNGHHHYSWPPPYRPSRAFTFNCAAHILLRASPF